MASQETGKPRSRVGRQKVNVASRQSDAGAEEIGLGDRVIFTDMARATADMEAKYSLYCGLLPRVGFKDLSLLDGKKGVVININVDAGNSYEVESESGKRVSVSRAHLLREDRMKILETNLKVGDYCEHKSMGGTSD